MSAVNRKQMHQRPSRGIQQGATVCDALNIQRCWRRHVPPQFSASLEIVVRRAQHHRDADLQQSLPRRVYLLNVSKAHCSYAGLGPIECRAKRTLLHELFASPWGMACGLSGK
jgi:hypothetical protein